MTFSIRMLLAVTLLLAVTFLLIGTVTSLRERTERLETTRAKTESLFADIAFYSVPVDLAEQYHADEVNSVSEIREKAVESFRQVQEARRVIQPKDSKTFAYRHVPALDSDDLENRQLVYRIHVPNDRPVWLKLGATKPDVQGYQLEGSKSIPDLLESKSLSPSGPFELQLPPGTHTLTFLHTREIQPEGEITVKFNEETLLKATCRSDSRVNINCSYSSPDTQRDIRPRSDLPWLLRAGVLEVPENGSSKKILAVQLWLNDQPSGFDAFPRSTQSREDR